VQAGITHNLTVAAAVMPCCGSSSPSSPILFLDVDGVLNTESSVKRNRFALEDNLLSRLGEVIKKTGCKIVLSSTWRLHQPCMDVLFERLRQHGLDSVIIDVTRDIKGAHRTDEIISWLQQNGHIQHWIAVDDMDLQKMCPVRFTGHTVVTDYGKGVYRL